MSVNKYAPHVLVLPEDDANGEIANGFLQEPALNLRAIQILRPAGGWRPVLDHIATRHAPDLATYRQRHLVLMIDFDDQVDSRLRMYRDQMQALPQDTCRRIFLLGSPGTPEAWGTALCRSRETIGRELAWACANQQPGLWHHVLLQHNQAELDRLLAQVRPFLFG